MCKHNIDNKLEFVILQKIANIYSICFGILNVRMYIKINEHLSYREWNTVC